MAPQVLNPDSVAIADHRPHEHGEKLPMASDSYWPERTKAQFRLAAVNQSSNAGPKGDF